jgi:C4-dicarboxylate-specific signal transduction histidine kinase
MMTLKKQLERERKKIEVLEKMFEDYSRELYLAEEERRQSQIKLFNVSKMASLGEMAGGIAHEINNPIAIIMLRAKQIKTMLEKSKTNPELAETFHKKIIDFSENISKTADRIAAIVNGLRVFARSGESDPFQATPLTKIITDTIALCHTQMNSHGIELVQETDDSIIIPCRPVQISQVIVNLLGNAIYELANAPYEPKRITFRTYQENQEAILSIADNGRGIPQDMITKILEPFFTTKPVGEGTGLGLSISNGIVQTHHGRIEVESQPGNTCFKIFLPLLN